MNMILCPECGTNISAKARTCPYCGFESEDTSLAISKQDQYVYSPSFYFEIEKWNPSISTSNIVFMDDRKINLFFSKWMNIEKYLPAIAQVLQEIFKKESILVADYDRKIAELIEKKIYSFAIDKNGEILPFIRDGKTIVKQVRLKEMTLPSQIAPAMNNLCVQVQLAQILGKMEGIEDAIQRLHREIHNDRIAMAESSWDRLLQARKVIDKRIRDSVIIGVIGAATDSKRMLMRNYTDNYNYIKSYSNKNLIESLGDHFKSKNVSEVAAEAVQTLVEMANSVKVECAGYSMLSEYDACVECLVEYRTFLQENKLDKRDTLLCLNSNLERKDIGFVDNFLKVSKGIISLDVRQFALNQNEVIV